MNISSITKYIDINIIKRRKRKIENIFIKYNEYEEDIFNDKFMHDIWRFTWRLGSFYLKGVYELNKKGTMYSKYSLKNITEWGN